MLLYLGKQNNKLGIVICTLIFIECRYSQFVKAFISLQFSFVLITPLTFEKKNSEKAPYLNMISKLITVLILFSFMKNTLQLQHKDIFTIIKEFNLNNPHLIGFMDNKLELIKLLSKNGHFSNIHQRIELLSINEKINTNAIVLLEAQSKTCYHLEIPKCLFCKFLLISRGKKFEELLNFVAAQTDINQKVFILKENSHEIYEA